ncbi:ribonuclease HII [Candidatus Nanosynbacter sp. TM7-074]|uniref:Multifunctional fusion protein n=1 Tax=Candidatus Nanosynbacter sp. TM7-074 TaxID=3158573 RepID=A0AB39JDD8_9BACT
MDWPGARKFGGKKGSALGMILGIDEVGRGAWAGPLVIGAVVLGGAEIEGLDDSKKLTKKRREGLDVAIREQASSWALGWVSAKELDEIGMSEALKLVTRRAVKEIQAKCQKNGSTFDEIIIDGTVNFLAGTPLEKYVTMIVKADGLIPSVSAASIIAKVARDKFMAEQDDIYPGYDFSSHVGYGVAKHRAAIDNLGITPLHRLSFAPLAKYVGVESNSQNVPGEESKSQQKDTTRQIGDKGEQAATDWLVADGHEIIERNWRTRYCEIDIVSKKDDVLYFTEVKYRKNDNFGDGLAAITNKKQQQMRFAAEIFISKNAQYENCDMRLMAISVDGNPPVVEECVVLE